MAMMDHAEIEAAMAGLALARRRGPAPSAAEMTCTSCDRLMTTTDGKLRITYCDHCGCSPEMGQVTGYSCGCPAAPGGGDLPMTTDTRGLIIITIHVPCKTCGNPVNLLGRYCPRCAALTKRE